MPSTAKKALTDDIILLNLGKREGFILAIENNNTNDYRKSVPKTSLNPTRFILYYCSRRRTDLEQVLQEQVKREAVVEPLLLAKQP